MRNLLLITLLASCIIATSQAQQVCEPGSTVKQDCNTCRCTDDGLHMACTRRFCVPEPEQMQGDAPVAEKMEADAPVAEKMQGDAPVAVEDANGKQVCTPNEVKMEDCNRCKCANNGIGWFCTRKACVPREKRGITRGSKQLYEGVPNTPGFSCQKGKSFPYECNTCTCSRDGKSAQCTFKLCGSEGPGPLPPFQTDRPQIQPTKDYEGVPNTPGFACQSGKSFQYECNTCTCNRNGKSAQCSYKLCETEGPGPLPPFQTDRPQIQPTKDYEGVPNTKGFTCTKGKTFQYECNTCTCLRDGKTAQCTYKLCETEGSGPLPPFQTDRPQIQPTKDYEGVPNTKGFTCTKGKTFQYECNTCTCSRDGKTAQCTYKLCETEGPGPLPPFQQELPQIQEPREYEGIPNTPGFKCTKGKTFQHECNTCTCNKNGRSASCTYKICERKKRAADRPQIQPTKNYEGVPNTPGFACQSGKSFQYECNTCTCDRNGKSAQCTYKICETDGPGPLPPFQPDRPAIQPTKDYEGVPNTKGFKCTKGKTFQYECNTCTCSRDGKTAQCTYKICENEGPGPLPPFQQELPQIQEPREYEGIPNTPGFKCTKGKTFQHECNSCTCNKNGRSASCTFKICERKKRDADWGTFKGVPNTDDFSCTPQTSFKYECNTCRCGTDGKTAACTFRFCLPGESRKKRDTAAEGIPNTPGFRCLPGQSFKYECNTCRCGLDGSSAACTFMACHPGQYRKKRQIAVQVPEFIPNAADDKCKPGTSWMNDCNNCFCTETGLGVCTLRACLPREKREAKEQPKCVPGTSFRDAEDCNDCFCTPSGHVACTEKLCLKKSKRQTKIPNTPGFTCVPGNAFKWECNNCRCASDGRTAACTAKLCIPGEV